MQGDLEGEALEVDVQPGQAHRAVEKQAEVGVLEVEADPAAPKSAS